MLRFHCALFKSHVSQIALKMGIKTIIKVNLKGVLYVDKNNLLMWIRTLGN